MQREYDALLADSNRQKNDLTIEFSEKFASIKEEASRQQRQLEIRFEEDRRSKESEHKREISDFNQKLEAAQNQNQALSQTNFNSNHSLEALQLKFTTLSENFEESSTQLKKLKTVKEALDNQVSSHEREIARVGHVVPLYFGH
jgi:hypothetical protein